MPKWKGRQLSRSMQEVLQKKQKTPVKDTVRAAFEELMQGEEEEKLNMARMERELASVASPLRSEPKNLTGTSDEARQKK
jgi:Asp/Glu/hydantoin racemase